MPTMSVSDDAQLAAVGLGLAFLAFALSAGLCGLVRRWAPRLGLVDTPGGRKAHRAPTPLGGGVAIWLTTVLVLAPRGPRARPRPRLAPRIAGRRMPTGSGRAPASWR